MSKLAEIFDLPTGDYAVLEECRDKAGRPLWIVDLHYDGGTLDAAWMGPSWWEAWKLKRELEAEGTPVYVLAW